MPTKRTPINRATKTRLSPIALDAFRRMQTAPTDDEWWSHHSILVRELRLKPWQWPAVEHPDAQCPYPVGSYAAQHWQPNLKAQARYRELERAARDAGVAAHRDVAAWRRRRPGVRPRMSPIEGKPEEICSE
jgi:hypothetical protein